MRARPPASPRNFARLPVSTSWTTEKTPAEALAHGRQLLRSKRFRADLAETSVNAEKGYLRETGNLAFHLSLLVVLLGVAVTAGFGYTGSALIKEHDGFTNTVIDYDDISHGRFVNVANLAPFSFTLNDFEATYHRGDNARGDADTFNANVTWQPNLHAAPRETDIRVNHPLATGGTNVYLGGHGYAPHFVIKDGQGRTFDETIPFLPQQGTYQYQGVVKLPDTRPSQLGITGFFLPTASTDPKTGQPVSVFPAPDNPAVVIGVFSGDLGLDGGIPQSVYTLDTSKMKRLLTTVMTPGQTVTLPDGLGTITFAGYDQWAAFNITHDPGKQIVLVAVCAMVAGLLFSLGVRRRRVWLRAQPDPAGRTLVEVGGLTRSDAHGGFDEEFARLVTALQAGIPPDDAGPDDAGSDDAVVAATGAAVTQAQGLQVFRHKEG
jgi:cytochrome c biogenesis protein